MNNFAAEPNNEDDQEENKTYPVFPDVEDECNAKTEDQVRNLTNQEVLDAFNGPSRLNNDDRLSSHEATGDAGEDNTKRYMIIGACVVAGILLVMFVVAARRNKEKLARTFCDTWPNNRYCQK